MIFKTNIVIDYRAREWCRLPYPDHPRGCPNYGRKSGCPPQAPLVENYFDVSKDHYFVVVQFDLDSHVSKMKENHPLWSDRQARCVLYWQSTVNKQLREECQFYTRQRNGFVYNLCPEAMGVNVIETCKAIGLPIKARPVDTVFKVAMLGCLKCA
ncbi:hypothetical protein ES703_101654 [subsurface metagenome]